MKSAVALARWRGDDARPRLLRVSSAAGAVYEPVPGPPAYVAPARLWRIRPLRLGWHWVRGHHNRSGRWVRGHCARNW